MARETIERPTTRPSWREPSSVLGDMLLIAAMGLVTLSLVTALDGRPDQVERLSISNPTDYELFVEVSGRGGWMPLAIVRPQAEVQLLGPVDHGDVWSLRFRSQGRTTESIDVRRSDVAARNWRLEVPASIGERLREQGTPVSPPR